MFIPKLLYLFLFFFFFFFGPETFAFFYFKNLINIFKLSLDPTPPVILTPLSLFPSTFSFVQAKIRKERREREY
jgi:hypothetical protein